MEILRGTHLRLGPVEEIKEAFRIIYLVVVIVEDRVNHIWVKLR